MIVGPGKYLDRAGRVAEVIAIAPHNPGHWLGIAGDGQPACWEATGVMECSEPSGIDLIEKLRPR